VVPANLSWEDMIAAEHPFLPLMRERGHLYLFTESGMRRLLERSGVEHVVFEPAYFAAYDMFVVASRRPLTVTTPAAVAGALALSPDSRLMQGLLDLDDRLCDLQARHTEVERDRAARLAVLQDHGTQLMIVEGERNALRAELENIRVSLAVSEADRAARLAVIQAQGARLAASEAEQGARLAASEAECAARLAVIQARGEQIAAAHAEVAAGQAVIQAQGARLEAAEADLDAGRRLIREQAARIDGVTAERESLRAELDALRFRGLRTAAVAFLRRSRALVGRLRAR
jgi:chromosome segregation ATPase